jgi:hypothetical protein
VRATSLHKSYSCATRSQQGTEVAMPSYNFVKRFNFALNMFEGAWQVFNLRFKFFRASTHRVEDLFQPLHAPVAEV